MMKTFGALCLFMITLGAFADERTPAPADAAVYIISPRHGETLTAPVAVRFGLRGMGVAPAGVDRPNTGHHHLLIDAAVPPLDRPIPKDDRHRHFGGGQTEAVVDLAPGSHTLRLILGDYRHRPHTPALVSEPVTITVRE